MSWNNSKGAILAVIIALIGMMALIWVALNDLQDKYEEIHTDVDFLIREQMEKAEIDD